MSVASSNGRRDAIWQRSDVADRYHRSRQGIPLADVQVDVMLQLIDAHGIEVRSLLDLGAGDGYAASEVMKQHAVERVVLVDFSEPMMALAHERFDGNTSDIHILAGDLGGHEWSREVEPLGPFDAVISRYAIHHVTHEGKRMAYARAHDLLKPGGLFVNIEHVKSACSAYEKVFQHLMIQGIHSLDPEGASVAEVEAAFHARQDRDTNILATVEEQCGWLRAMGFTDVDCAFKLFELSVFAGRKP